MNSVTLIGRAGADPEVRYFESGACLAKVSIALDNPPSKGEKSLPTWISLQIWGKVGQVAANHLRKGDRFAVQGALAKDTWKHKDTGAECSSVYVRVSRLELLGSKAVDESDVADGDEF